MKYVKERGVRMETENDEQDVQSYQAYLHSTTLNLFICSLGQFVLKILVAQGV
jgi:hypothetical protein